MSDLDSTLKVILNFWLIYLLQLKGQLDVNSYHIWTLITCEKKELILFARENCEIKPNVFLFFFMAVDVTNP